MSLFALPLALIAEAFAPFAVVVTLLVKNALLARLVFEVYEVYFCVMLYIWSISSR